LFEETGWKEQRISTTRQETCFAISGV